MMTTRRSIERARGLHCFRCSCLILISLLLTCNVLDGLSSSKRTIIIPLPGAVDRVTYDGNGISEREIRRILALSPEVAPFNNLLVPEWLELCDPKDREYVTCDRNSLKGASFLHNAGINLRRIKARIATLKESEYPSDLGPVVRYLRSIQQFAYWKESQRLEYIQTGKLDLLKQAFNGIQPGQQCTAEIEKVQDAPNMPTALRRSRIEWGNCVWRIYSKEIGGYPVNVWQKFLRRHGAEEKVLQDNGNDE